MSYLIAPNSSKSAERKRRTKTSISNPEGKTALNERSNKPSFIFNSRRKFLTSLQVFKSNFSPLISMSIPIQTGAFNTFAKYSG